MADGRGAVVLLSGGMDSATTLAIAQNQGYQCYALSFDYGQQHQIELAAARRIAQHVGVAGHRILKLNLGDFGGSALTDDTIAVPKNSNAQTEACDTIPVTYVPARNIVFLSLALAWAEVLDIQDIFIGVNAVDYSGYPDCRPAFIEAFEKTANLATRRGVEGKGFCIKTPLISMRKSEIIQCGTRLGIDYAVTISCYVADGKGRACGACDACRFRKRGFAEAGIADPTCYYSAREGLSLSSLLL